MKKIVVCISLLALGIACHAGARFFLQKGTEERLEIQGRQRQEAGQGIQNEEQEMRPEDGEQEMQAEGKGTAVQEVVPDVPVPKTGEDHRMIHHVFRSVLALTVMAYIIRFRWRHRKI